MLNMRIRAGEKATIVKEWAEKRVKAHAEEQANLEEAAAFVFEIEQLDLGASVEKHEEAKAAVEEAERLRIEAEERKKAEAIERKRMEVPALYCVVVLCEAPI